jgi:hypothetical protein
VIAGVGVASQQLDEPGSGLEALEVMLAAARRGGQRSAAADGRDHHRHRDRGGRVLGDEARSSGRSAGEALRRTGRVRTFYQRQPMVSPRIERAVDLMIRFADRTGLTSARPPRRYLWTDAFAVCNFLGLARLTGDGRYTELALRLVDQVHHVLGCHRADDARTGWLSGLDAREGQAHPTRGGLRIGKRLPERGPGERADERLEWDRDGQYFHYLTKWMHALDQVAGATGQPMFNLWARELAAAAHGAFTYALPGGGKRMYWKASIDLSRPQVASMGHHDPLDGFITCVELEATAARLPAAAPGPRLAAASADFAGMLEPRQLATSDPLGLGGLLVDANRVEQLMRQGRWTSEPDLLEALLGAVLVGLQDYLRQPDLRSPAGQRLAFRELGLAIGLAAAGLMEQATGGVRGQLAPYAALRAEVESFWLSPAHRETRPWLDHEDINDVMLATSLAPEGFLVLDRTGAVA